MILYGKKIFFGKSSLWRELPKIYVFVQLFSKKQKKKCVRFEGCSTHLPIRVLKKTGFKPRIPGFRLTSSTNRAISISLIETQCLKITLTGVWTLPKESRQSHPHNPLMKIHHYINFPILVLVWYFYVFFFSSSACRGVRI